MIKRLLKRWLIYLQQHQYHRKRLLRIFWYLLPERAKNKLREITLYQVSYNLSPAKKLCFNGKKYTQAPMSAFPKGVNVVGFAKGDFGLAEHCRLTTLALQGANTAFCVINADEVLRSKTNDALDAFIVEHPRYNTNLLSFNADNVLNYALGNHDQHYDKRYNIGYGYWETSEYPNPWAMQNNVVDEIWAPSRYVQEVIAAKASVPVLYMPIAVDFTIPYAINRADFSLPENKFLFLFSFDMSSFITRKNPQAVIDAFVKAFPQRKQSEHLGLVIKLNWVRGDLDHRAKLERLKNQAKELNLPVIFIDEMLSRQQMLGLINCCNCYVSLHRSEGFGLGMAEAMKMGKAVIGTNYSANTDFMKHNNACLVDYQLRPVKKDQYQLIEDGAVWAEADIDHAAYYMQKLVNDHNYAQSLGQKAKQYMDKHHNFAVIGERYRKRLEFLDLI